MVNPSYTVNIQHDQGITEFGRGYWINISATAPITLWVKGASASAQESIEGMPYPPATYYGVVNAGQGFTPTASLPVTAQVGDKVCGQTRTTTYEGEVVYAINVSADGPGSMAGCGAPGKSVTFTVGARAMATTAVWDNSSVAELSLHPAAANSIFLPIILRAR